MIDMSELRYLDEVAHGVQTAQLHHSMRPQPLPLGSAYCTPSPATGTDG